MEIGHDKGRICKIGEEWATIDTDFKNAQGAVVHPDTYFRRSKDYYNKRLKELYDNGNRDEKHQAHHVSEIETSMKYMEVKLDRTSNHIEQLHENQEELASAYHVGEWMDTISRVQLAIAIVDRALINAETVRKMVSDGMALMTKELRSELAIGTTRSKAAPRDKKGYHDGV